MLLEVHIVPIVLIEMVVTTIDGSIVFARGGCDVFVVIEFGNTEGRPLIYVTVSISPAITASIVFIARMRDVSSIDGAVLIGDIIHSYINVHVVGLVLIHTPRFDIQQVRIKVRMVFRMLPSPQIFHDLGVGF